MLKPPKSKEVIPLFANKKMISIYSFYLAIGSVSFFIFINSVYTTMQAIFWKYSDVYILDAAIISIVALSASFMFLSTCYLMLKGKKISRFTGLFGCIILIVYPLYVLYIGKAVPSSFDYLLMVFIPAMILLIVLLILWKKLT